MLMVGLGGLEPLTSRLSGGRSNQLSYKPVDSEHPRADLRALSGGADPARLLLPRLYGRRILQCTAWPDW